MNLERRRVSAYERRSFEPPHARRTGKNCVATRPLRRVHELSIPFDHGYWDCEKDGRVFTIYMANIEAGGGPVVS